MCEGNEIALITNLIVHYDIMNFSNQIIKFICILDVVKEPFNSPLPFQ